jgi:hypothetical protein
MRRRLDGFIVRLLCVTPRERILFLLVLAAGLAVRLVAPQLVPNGFNNDEASLGYDA